MPITEVPPGLGSAFSPEQWSSYVLQHLTAASVVLSSGATRIDTTLRQIHVPRITSAGGATWLNELKPIPENAPPGDELVLVPKKLATIAKLSSEVVADSSPSILDNVGSSLVRAVALKADRAFLTGSDPKGPQGVYAQAGHHVTGPIDIDHLIDASGLIAGDGGTARVAYLNPLDFTALLKSNGSTGRPLLQSDFAGGPASTIFGLQVWQTDGIAPATALVAAPEQIVCAIRQDPQVSVSTDAAFVEDGALCRVICRVDVGAGDARGLVSMAATAEQAEVKGEK